MRALILCALCACSGQSGLISVSLTTAPGSAVLDAVQTLRVTVTEPHQVIMAERKNGGFDLALDLDATGAATRLLVDGLDAGGALVAAGASPAFPVGAIDAAIVIYMAAPNSVGAAPRSLDPPRAELASGTLSYGAIFAGGRDATGASDLVIVYNAFDHSLVTGLGLPAPRAGMMLAIGLGGVVYMFGGRDEADTPTATTWRFDTTIAPAGAYTDYGTKDGFARADEVMLPIGNDHFLISGAPAAELSGADGTMVARDPTALPPAGATVTANDGVVTTIFAGADGVVRYRTGAFTALPITEATRAGASVVAAPGGKIAVLCGTTDAVRIDAASGSAEVFAGMPNVAKTGCATAATTRYIIIAGGTSATGVDGSVAVYDAATFELIATPQLVVPRTSAVAIALPDDQILIAGGVDASGAPVGTLELFTPEN